VLCVVRSADGRWLAAAAPPGLATWAGAGASAPAARWRSARTPRNTLARELEEEWSVLPERLAVEALVCLPNRMAMLVGQALAGRGSGR
jgi:hypothetical protein